MKIILIRACAVGDFILNLPALEALQETQHSIEFTLVGYPSTLEIAREFIAVSAIHSLEVEPWRNLFHGPLPGLQFDRGIVWMKSDVVAQNLRASGIRDVIRADPFPTSGHAAGHLLQTIGLASPKLPDRWQPSSPRVILHPGSGSPAKCWPFFRELAERLDSATFLLGPLESKFETGGHPRIENVALREVAHMLSSSRAFVGNDSGITHLAAHLGVPTIALFGPTDPQMWGPLGRRVSIIARPDLRTISVEEVIRHLQLL